MKGYEGAYSDIEVVAQAVAGLSLAGIIGLISGAIIGYPIFITADPSDCGDLGLACIFVPFFIPIFLAIGGLVVGFLGGLIGLIVGFLLKRIFLGATIGGALAALVLLLISLLF